MSNKKTIGRAVKIDLPTEGIDGVLAKIDTGADSSSIWASDIYMDNAGMLHFSLFDSGSSHYTGKTNVTSDYEARVVRSSNGTAQIRYKIKLQILIEGVVVESSFTLADRSRNTFPILIGCNTLSGEFVVDPDLGYEIWESVRRKSGLNLTEQLRSNPRAFFEKYHFDNNRGDI